MGVGLVEVPLLATGREIKGETVEHRGYWRRRGRPRVRQQDIGPTSKREGDRELDSRRSTLLSQGREIGGEIGERAGDGGRGRGRSGPT